MTAAVSVVVPTYNRAPMLRRLLDALEAQVPVPGGYELVIVDDGSSDDTEAVVRRSELHPRYVRQANRGPAAARNAGWRLAQGAIVAFTDDDTIPSREWLRDLVLAFDDDPPADAVGGRIVALETGFLADFVQLDGQVDHDVDEDGQVRYLVTANAAWRRRALAALGGFDESFELASGEDVELSMRALGSGMRLISTDRAVVAHDHRATVRTVFATFRKHGRSREQVVGATLADQPRRRRALLAPKEWANRYRSYRQGGCSRARAAAYVGLRLCGLFAYALGLATALWLRRHPAPGSGRGEPAERG